MLLACVNINKLPLQTQHSTLHATLQNWTVNYSKLVNILAIIQVASKESATDRELPSPEASGKGCSALLQRSACIHEQMSAGIYG